MATEGSQRIHVGSEIGRLKGVIVHEPGPELLAVTPSNRAEYLYDDIIDLAAAREEHRRFTSVLRHFSEVLTVGELLEETLAVPEARDFLLTRSEEVTADRRLRAAIGECEPGELARRYIEGWRAKGGAFSEQLDVEGYVLPPLPNLFFTRDASVVVGDQVLISAMRFATRWPEEALMRTIFGFHPRLGQPSILYDGSDERRHDYIFEGGDIHPISPTAVVVGISERTSVTAIDQLTEDLFEDTPVTDVIVVVLPQPSTAIHLDMVWTQVDRGLFVAHPPMFKGPRRVPILRRRKGHEGVIECESIFAALRDAGSPMEAVWAGGGTRQGQEREQWASGCNFLAVGPGQVISYARNEGTLRALEGAGFRLVDGEDLLLGDDRVSDDERVAITFSGSELVRGGGGPRCMTCPVWRAPLD